MWLEAKHNTLPIIDRDNNHSILTNVTGEECVSNTFLKGTGIMTTEELVKRALTAKKMAYAPFSHFRVGAVLVTEDDQLYEGCNIEISSFGLTICAERLAIFKAVSEGQKKFKSIFIASDSEKLTPPCGACRQVLWELAGNIEVIMINRSGNYQKSSMQELLPLGFDKTFLTTKH